MGRGYAVSRSRSARPTLRMKRERSESLHKLAKATTVTQSKTKDGESAKGAPKTTPTTRTASQQERDGRHKIVVRRRSVSAHPPLRPSSQQARSLSKSGSSATANINSTTSQRKRSASAGALLSERVHRLEQKLQDHMADSEDDEDKTSHHDTMNKYIALGKAVDETLQVVVAACVPGASTKDLCDLGDRELQTRVKSLFQKAREETTGQDGTLKKRRLSRGLSFPTSVSVNEVLCNHSPYKESEATRLCGHDVVKIHMGAHLDGFPVMAAQTIFVPPTAAADGEKKEAETPLDQTAVAAYEAARRALQMLFATIAPDTLNADLTDVIATVGRSYKVEALEGVLSHRSKRWVPDCLQASIINRRVVMTEPQQDVADCTLQAGQVWCLDVAFTNNGCSPHPYDDSNSNSTGGDGGNTNEEEEGEGTDKSTSANTDSSLRNFYFNKVKPYKLVPVHNVETCIFRRRPEDLPEDSRVHQANETLEEINRLFFCFPFHFKHFVEQPLKYKMGLNVLCKQKIMDAFPPLQVKKVYQNKQQQQQQQAQQRVVTTRFAATVVITNRRVTILCGAPPLRRPPVADELLPPAASTLVSQFQQQQQQLNESTNTSETQTNEGLVQVLTMLEAAEKRAEEDAVLGAHPQALAKGMPLKLLDYAQREFALPTYEEDEDDEESDASESSEEEEVIEEEEDKKEEPPAQKKSNTPKNKNKNKSKNNANKNNNKDNNTNANKKKRKQKKANKKTGEKAKKATRVE